MTEFSGMVKVFEGPAKTPAIVSGVVREVYRSVQLFISGIYWESLEGDGLD